ncbi:MAG: glutamyl-tRNA reductase [Chthoniobacteraceae bacterium]
MEVLCLGLSHKTAPVETRERFAVGDAHLGEFSALLARTPGLHEAVVISTCNRVEYYAAADDSAAGLRQVSDFIAAKCGHAPQAPTFIELKSAEGIRHLFRVVSGLESMVLGETEILGQVKKAYQSAHSSGATSRTLNKLFQRAFNVAKEVRTKTSITRGAVSVGSAAVELAEKIFGRLDACNVMVLGAGETAEMTAKALQSRGAKAIFVSNRTYERAVSLAEMLGGRAIHFDQWESEFDAMDILIGSTGAPHAVVTSAKIAPLMTRRQDRPLFCIDLAVPRDFEPGVNDIEGVYLYDIDALQGIAEESMQVRRQELVRCEEMIERHVAEFSQWLSSPRPNHGAAGMQPEGAK